MTTATLRDVPLGLLESMANQSDGSAALTAMIDTPAPSAVDELMNAIASTSSAPTSAKRSGRRSRRIDVDGPRDDSFYEAVAAAYGDLVAEGSAPAPALAEQTGAAPQTVHGWVREARRRGFLAPARHGKAG